MDIGRKSTKRGLAFTKKIRIWQASCIIVFLSGAAPVHSQSDDKSAVTFGGGATITGDIYDFSSTPAGANRPRRPANLWRLILTPTITVGDYFSLPFNIMLSSRETNTITPGTSGSSFLQFVQNPMNNLGFLSISPKFGWAQFHLGTHVPRYSELSSGDGQVFGSGIDIRPGIFRFSASAGSVQRAIEPDSARHIRGAYARWIYLTKIGVGTETGSLIDLNIVRARDDPASIGRRPEGMNPEEGILVSFNTRITLTEGMFITAEGGTSIFTRDMSADDLTSADKTLSGIIRQRTSTRTDYAGTASFNLAEKTWGVRAAARYIGAGYVALGYPYMQPDRLEFTLSPRVQLLDNNLNISGSIGHRTNNLSNTKGATSNQLIGSANLFWNATENFNISSSYSNFGIRNNLSLDTLKIETVSQSFNFSPSYTIPTTSVTHMLTATYAQDNFNDFNTVSGAENSNITQSVLGTYSASFINIPLSTNLTGSYLTNDLKVGALTVVSVTLGGSYRLAEGKVVPSLALTWSKNRLGDNTPDSQMYYRLSTRWQITRKLTWSVAASRNNYAYGSSRPDVSFAETFVQTALTMQF